MGAVQKSTAGFPHAAMPHGAPATSASFFRIESLADATIHPRVGPPPAWLSGRALFPGTGSTGFPRRRAAGVVIQTSPDLRVLV